MEMGEGVEWTLHCATILAALPDGAVLPASALAEFHDISESYLLKQLRAMTAAGLFASVPGPKGGYRLARPAEEISLLDIVLAVEGDQPAFRCSEIRRCGPTASPPSAYSATCAIHAAMWTAERAWRASLASTSLADITRRIGRGLSAEVRAKAQTWLGANVRT
jgi:Rrf2 family protein